MKKTVTVFGSAMPEQGSREYSEAYELGKLLGAGNLNVCSGGYGGIMDAVSRGAVEAGSEATGITVRSFGRKPSRWLTINIICDSLVERISRLVEYADAFIILPGGTGTLLEVAYIWEFMNKNFMDSKPAAASGKLWKSVISEVNKRLEEEMKETNRILCFNTTPEAGNYIINSLKS